MSKSSHPKFKIIIRKIEDLTESVNFEVKFLLRNGFDTFSLAELKNRIKAPIKKNSNIKILSFYESTIKQLEHEGRIGYSKVFVTSGANLRKFMKGADKSFIAFSKIDFENYERFLLANVKSEIFISVYIRTFTRLWNIAIDQGFCSKSTIHQNTLNLKPIDVLKQKKGLYQQM
ncbi:MAG: phage integrase SAM-like domain-containing protein [Ginsengibacter sp.]